MDGTGFSASPCKYSAEKSPKQTIGVCTITEAVSIHGAWQGNWNQMFSSVFPHLHTKLLTVLGNTGGRKENRNASVLTTLHAFLWPNSKKDSWSACLYQTSSLPASLWHQLAASLNSQTPATRPKAEHAAAHWLCPLRLPTRYSKLSLQRKGCKSRSSRLCSWSQFLA